MTVTDTEAMATDVVTLRVADRCDRCGAQAWVVVKAPGDAESPLLFCGHHFREHEPALLAQGANILVDNRDQINTAPSLSATL